MKKVMIFSVLTIISSVAMAGYQYTPQVYINSAGTYARGSMVGAHTSADAIQRIRCTTEKWTSGSSHTWCSATNSSGTSVLCSSWNADLVDATMAIADESYISFQLNSSGQCTHIRIENGSYFKE